MINSTPILNNGNNLFKGSKKRYTGLTHAELQYIYRKYTESSLYFRKKYRLTEQTFGVLQLIYNGYPNPVKLAVIYKYQSNTYYATVKKLRTLIERGLIEKVNVKYILSELAVKEFENRLLVP